MADVISMPKLGFDMAEGTLVRWVILEGQNVAKGAVLAEIETDKATVEVESAHEGTLLKHLVSEGAIVPVNMPIAVIGAAGETVDLAKLGLEEAPAPAEKTPEPAETSETPAAPPDQVAEAAVVVDSNLPDGLRASPLARRMAREMGIDLRQVQGSGPAGRITKADVEGYKPAVVSAQEPTESAPAEKAAGIPLPALTPVSYEARPDTRVSMTRLRQAIARRMLEAKQQVPHFYVTHDYNMAPVLELRKQINALLPEDEKLSVNDFIMKATALALRVFPNLNATIDLQKNEVIQHGQVHIGVAVAVENGLLTVVCRDTDLKSLRQISTEVKNLAGRARAGKVRPEDIEGSTFSISNLGMFDVESFIAIINPPEAAILAVGSAKEVPVVVNGEIKPGVRMKATISVDHKVSDGAEAARFMQTLAQYLEEPLRLLV